MRAEFAGAAATRLSCFNVHMLDPDAGTFTDLPTDLAIIASVALMLLDVPLLAAEFRILLSPGAIGRAALMVSALPIPKMTGRPYAGVIAAGVALVALYATHLGGRPATGSWAGTRWRVSTVHGHLWQD